MTSSIEAVVAALNAAGVQYLVVGGVAVVLHGHLRTTADLDLVVELSELNVTAAIEALEELDFRARAPVPARQFIDPDQRRAWIADKGLTVFSLWSPAHPGLEVDLFATEPFDFRAAYARAVTVDLDSTTATVASLDDLIEMKRAANRPLDQADIVALQAVGAFDGNE